MPATLRRWSKWRARQPLRCVDNNWFSGKRLAKGHQFITRRHLRRGPKHLRGIDKLTREIKIWKWLFASRFAHTQKAQVIICALRTPNILSPLIFLQTISISIRFVPSTASNHHHHVHGDVGLVRRKLLPTRRPGGFEICQRKICGARGISSFIHKI